MNTLCHSSVVLQLTCTWSRIGFFGVGMEHPTTMSVSEGTGVGDDNPIDRSCVRNCRKPLPSHLSMRYVSFSISTKDLSSSRWKRKLVHRWQNG